VIGFTAAVRRIVSANAPVICVDTCSLLDLTRDPIRGKFMRQHAEAALHLVARAEQRPASVTIVLAEQVLRELSDHLAAVGAEAERAIERLNRALEVCDAYGVFSGVPHLK
jgi:hypothetical protein